MHSRPYRIRSLKDRLARYLVAIGGIGVIAAILLIFFYLLYVVVPMFGSAHMTQSAQYGGEQGAEVLHLGIEERGTMAVRFTADGRVSFFDAGSGEVVQVETLSLPAAITAVTGSLNTVALALANGQVLVVRYQFKLSYPDDVRTVTPVLEYPLGHSPIDLDESGQALRQIALQLNEDVVGIAALTQDGRLVFARYVLEESFLSGDIEVTLESLSSRAHTGEVVSIALTPGLQHLYVAARGALLTDYVLDEDGFAGAAREYRMTHDITRLQLLLGGNSLLVALQTGEVQQWMQVRGEHGRSLQHIRSFAGSGEPLTAFAIEQERKGFATADGAGRITLYYTTSHRQLAQIENSMQTVRQMAFSARADHLIVADAAGAVRLYRVHNEYPEVSWQALWGKVWYEGYDEPDYIWQSSASTNDFEPKYSLIPLSFGTIKAALYAMLFAVPIALLGAMFTAQFMAPKMRRTVKPSIEIMEALPTVILGFLAGLWLAPYVEAHLAGVFVLLVLLPLGFIACAGLWRFVPNKAALEGWEAALLIPVVVLLVMLANAVSAPIEQWFFEGDLRTWLSVHWGLDYDQRNALVVGLIMGFAVIPTIFSIAEDALFSVPQHLIRGSLALGATRWQTMVFVVLPAASPGIFSAVMMGFGRAVGETMIVLMATGNTPLMDMSIFQGMRTLAANIAVEVPEAEVASTHYRVLFLAALVLFLFTFIFNTLAEVIRQRLRERYSGL